MSIISPSIFITTIIWLPLLAAVILALYPLALRLLRGLPTHEIEQAVRAPAWLGVAVGGGVALLSLLAWRSMPPGGEQILITWPQSAPALMVDYYALWASGLLGVIMAVACWVPAARRSLAPHTTAPFLLVLFLFWALLLLLFSVRLEFSALIWGLAALLAASLGALLFRAQWRWHHTEAALVFAGSSALLLMGLCWLRVLSSGEDLTNIWHAMLIASPGQVNAAVFLVMLGWLGPLVYLPWWSWERHDEASMVWLPAGLVLATGGMLALTRLLFLAFPMGGMELAQFTGDDHLIVIARMLAWLRAWSLLTLGVGAGWLLLLVIRPSRNGNVLLRPITLVAAGLLMLGLAVSLETRQPSGLPALLWLHLLWIGVIAIGLAARGLLPALSPRDRGERGTLLATLALALTSLVAFPFTPGFRAMQGLWTAFGQAGVPHLLVIAALVITGVSSILLLPKWVDYQFAQIPRPGAAWGILGPLALAVLLFCAGILGGVLSPLFDLIRRSLLQLY